MVTLTGLFVYPLKSARGIALHSGTVGVRGLAHDRRFMLVDPAGRFLTQREVPMMARLVTALRHVDTGHGELEISFEDGTLRVPLQPTLGFGRRVRVFSDEVTALDLGAEAARFFTQALRRDAALVYMPDQSVRRVDPTRAEPRDVVSFADGFPYLLASESSLAALNLELDDPVGMERFRPNFVISGLPAYAEDEFRDLSIGGLPFVALKPSSRCVIVNTDQLTGAREKSVLQALGYSHSIGNRAIFGQNLVARGLGTVHLGDRVEITAHTPTGLTRHRHAADAES